MSKSKGSSSGRLAVLSVFAAGIAAVVAASQLTAQTGPDYDRIEEDWEIVISTPEPATNAPQLINVISSTWHTNTQHAVYEVNHATQPSYAQGGWQLQRWYGDIYREAKTSNPATVLSTPGETVSYTLRMEVTSGVLRFTLLNGNSGTWGAFGGDSQHVQVSSLVSNLNGYSKSLSVDNAKIGFGGHRVSRFALKEVRYYSGGVLVNTDSTVHEIPIPGAGA